MSQSGILSDVTTPLRDVETLSGNQGGATGPDLSGNIALLGPRSIGSVSVPGSNLLNFYGNASYVVGSLTEGMPFQTISAAITQAIADGTSASSQANIIVKPGTYIEDITIPAGVNVMVWDLQMAEQNQVPDQTTRLSSVIINGTVTFSGASSHLQGVTVLPISTNNSLINTGTSQALISNCKIYVNNSIGLFCSTGGGFSISNSSIIKTTTSISDSFYSTASSAINIYLYDCQVQADSLASSGPANIYMNNTNAQFHLTTAVVNGDVGITMLGSKLVTNAAADLFLVDAASDLFLTLEFSEINATNGDVISSASATSEYRFTKSVIKGTITINNNPAIYTVTDSSFEANSLIRTSSQQDSHSAGAVSYELINKNAALNSEAYFSTLTQPLGDDCYYVVACEGSRAYCWGQSILGSNVLNFTTAAASTVTPSTGTTILQYQPANNLWDFTSKARFSNTFVLTITSPGAYPYNVLTSDVFVAVNTGSARSIVLPSTNTAGALVYIKDATGAAASNNITVTVSGGGTIDGVASYIMSTNWQSSGFLFNGANYLVI